MYRFATTMMTVALALGFQSAHAFGPQPGPPVVVHFADLDLSRSQGAAVLYQRLKVAAETVCFPFDDDLTLARQRIYKACVQSAISTAVAKVHRPALTAYYEANTTARNGTTQIAQNR